MDKTFDDTECEKNFVQSKLFEDGTCDIRNNFDTLQNVTMLHSGALLFAGNAATSASATAAAVQTIVACIRSYSHS